MLPFSFKAALLKGRNHYICMRKFEQRFLDYYEDNYDSILSKGQLLIWLTETETGDGEELNLPSLGKGFWQEISSDSESCTNRQCPWFTRCFYHRARKKASEANIVITNHALLFTDVIHEQQILPAYKHVIIDEAHHLEDVVSRHLGVQTDYVSFTYYFNRLGTLEDKGLLNRIKELADGSNTDLKEDLLEVDKLWTDIRFELDELFRMIRSYVLRKRSEMTEVGRLSYRYYTNAEKGEMWSAILELAMRVSTAFQRSLRYFHGIYDLLEKRKEEWSYEKQGILADFKRIMQDLDKEVKAFNQLLLEYDPNLVYWIETEEKGAKNATFLYSKPVEVGEDLADRFFMKKRSVILTSATLTVKNSYNFIVERLGLTDFGPATLTIPSPFSYEQQAKVFIPTDTLNIKEVDTSLFVHDIAVKIGDIAEITNGKMLVLFTSFDMLRKTYEQLKHLGKTDAFTIIGQGINSGSRAKLMKTFKEHESAILLGTSSFWEGIDIPGEDLSCLVIVRLPFSPPNDPLLHARSERLLEEGKNPFMELSLPQAIIRFKQGFGRLIRTSSDRGIVFVLDKRIYTTRYGSLFLKSLPPVTVSKGPMEEMLEQIKSWFETKK